MAGTLTPVKGGIDIGALGVKWGGVPMSISRIANVAYHFAQRARICQELDGMGIEGSLAGKRPPRVLRVTRS